MTEPGATGSAAERVAVLADDLIWATRLSDALAQAGAAVTRTRTQPDLEAILAQGEVRRVVIDLTARAYDGVAAVGVAAASGARVAAVGQHDDLALRQRATAAGAERVFVYRQLFESGRSKLAAWLAEER